MKSFIDLICDLIKQKENSVHVSAKQKNLHSSCCKEETSSQEDQATVAAILFPAHRWEEVEKQSFRVKRLELSVGQGENRFTLY